MTTPGLHPNIPFEDYLRWPHLTRGVLKTLLYQTPAHAKHERDNSSESSASQRLGTLTHTALLEPDKMDELFIAEPTGARRGTKAWAACEEENAGKLVVKQDEWDAALAMRDATMKCREFVALRKKSRFELSAVWHNNVAGEPCKGRMDIWSEYGSGIIADLKTAASAHPDAFQKAIWNYGYHIQAAWYRSGAKALGLSDAPEFYFIVVESSPPHATAIYRLDSESIAAGEAQVNAALRKYARCKELGVWPSWDGVREIGLSEWQLRQVEEQHTFQEFET